MQPILNPYVLMFLDSLSGLRVKPLSVWVIGSQANGRATASSDTDLLVFGSAEFLDAVRSELEPPEGIDCLVVFNGNDFEDPWREKSGVLSRWNWAMESPNEAQYVATKWVVDAELGGDHGNFETRKEKAIRVWPI